MAYALIAWQAPAGASQARIRTEIEEALPSVPSGAGPAHFLDGLLLYPSPPVGIGFSTVRNRMKDVVKNNPGLELVIVMPEAGDTVAGWLDPARGTFPEARPVMNRSGADTFPLLLPSPASDGNGG